MNHLYSAAIVVTLLATFILGGKTEGTIGEGRVRTGAGKLDIASPSTDRRQAHPAAQGQPAGDDGDRDIRATELFSIPFGFASTLPLSIDGKNVYAIGHGGCTEGEGVTVAVTVTQSATGAVATGQWQGTCTGGLQRWIADAAIVGEDAFEAGTADVCGLATTRSDGEVTATDEWCPEDGVTLTWRAYVPAILSRSEQ